MNSAADDQYARSASRLPAGLAAVGWIDGRNLGSSPAGRRKRRAHSQILPRNWSRLRRTSSWPPATSHRARCKQATRTIPIVFVDVGDPVGTGFVASLARPGGNATGFTRSSTSLSGKWLELLKEIAPDVTRAAVLRDPAISWRSANWAPSRPWRRRSAWRLTPVDVRDADEIERAVAAFARSPNGGLIVTASSCGDCSSRLIIALAARHRLPAVYSYRVTSSLAGGLISYGPDLHRPVSGGRPPTSTAFSRARSRPTCRCKRRPSTSW